MNWTFVAHFTKSFEDRWLIPYVPGNRHQIQLVLNQRSKEISWHQKRIGVTGFDEWIRTYQQSKKAFTHDGGIITAFPPPAVTAGIQQRLSRRATPIVAWCFNVGAAYLGLKGWLAQQSLKDINRFVVHSQFERERYSQWLQLPIDRFEFVPYQIPEIPFLTAEQVEDPFLLAMGSAHRDYRLLFEVVEKLGFRTIVVAADHALKGLSIPANVEIRNGLTQLDCYRLAQQARVNVIPLLDSQETATGSSTIVPVLRMGRAAIATAAPGSVDYMINGKTGLLTTAGSAQEMMEGIEALWSDQSLRQRLGQAAALHAKEYFSDEAAGKALGQILDSVADQVGQY